MNKVGIGIVAAALLALAGCASTVETQPCFKDGRCLDVISFEQRTSMLNSALVTSVEDPKSGQIQTTVQGGTSTGKALLDVGNAVLMGGTMGGFAALIGTGNNNVNLNAAVTPKP